MLKRLPAPLLSLLPLFLCALVIFAARAMTFTDWAAANTGWAAFLFAWIVADALMLTEMYRAKDHKPPRYKVLGALAIACIIVGVGAAQPVREVYLGLPQVLAAAGLTLVAFVCWSFARFAQETRKAGSLFEGLESVLPSPFGRFVVTEMRMMHLALFRWNAQADVPEGARAFTYHTYLTPMLAAFMVLQVLELSVVHLLLMLWNPTVAWVMFALSIGGLLWTIAFIKSLRINPVLLTENGVRARFGMVNDLEVPFAQIAEIDRPFSKEELDSKRVLNFATFSSPNVALRFAQPIAIPTAFGGKREITGVAMRLDESAEFLAELRS